MSIVVRATTRLSKVRTGASKANREDADSSKTGVVPGPINGEVEVFVLEEIGLLDWKDFLELLADLLEVLAASFLTMF